jgi:hypothetical protein
MMNVSNVLEKEKKMFRFTFDLWKLIFDASPLRTHHSGERTKTGWLGIRIVCPSVATCLSAGYCFSEIAL